MGNLAGRKLGRVLALAALAVALMTLDELLQLDRTIAPVDPADWASAWTLGASTVAVVTLVIAHGALRSASWFVRVAALLLGALYFLPIAREYAWVDFVLWVLVFFVLVRERSRELWVFLILGSLLIVSCPALAIAWRAFGHVGLVALLVTAKLGDVAGYYVGSAIGKRHPFPNVSPGKTLEGCLGSLVAGVLAGAACVPLELLPEEPYGLVGGALAGAIVNLTAQASDLLESWVKRRAGVKDAGTWFGPSGGMLDLVDSVFLAAPAALLLWPLVLSFDPLP
jgi:CDP-diglyceride synthetase